MKSQYEPAFLFPGTDENRTLRFIYSDTIAGVLGEIPELTQAVRAGDISTVSTLCARLYESNSTCKKPTRGTHPVST